MIDKGRIQKFFKGGAYILFSFWWGLSPYSPPLKNDSDIHRNYYLINTHLTQNIFSIIMTALAYQADPTSVTIKISPLKVKPVNKNIYFL